MNSILHASRHCTARTEARSKPETSSLPTLIEPTKNPEEPLCLSPIVSGNEWGPSQAQIRRGPSAV